MKNIFLLLFMLVSKFICYSQTSVESYNKGVEKLKIEDWQGAIANFNDAIKLNPNYIDAYYSRAVTEDYMLKDHLKAIEDYNKCIKLSPRNAKAYFHRGDAKNEINDYKGAISDYTKAIDILPNYGDAYYTRGLTEISMGQKENGCSDLIMAKSMGVIDVYKEINQYCK